MTQLTDIGLLKHHRVDYGASIGDPERRSRKPFGAGVIALALIAFAVNIFAGISA